MTGQGRPAALKSRDEEMAGFTALNEKQAQARRNGVTESNVKMRAQLWPDLNEGRLWLRTDKTRKGFTTMPRTMALIINVTDNISK